MLFMLKGTIKYVKRHLHWQRFKAKQLAIARRNSHYYTCLGHLGPCYTKTNDPMLVMLPNVAKASTLSAAITDVFT
jgi:hypothetical protein